MNASNEDDIVPTSDELSARTSSWTLACDNLLLNKLKRFSKELEQTGSELNYECQRLSRDATVLQSKLQNVTNQFLAISSNQFVENRVQDFEEAAASVSAKTVENIVIKKTKAEKEAELITKMKKAIQIGISVNSENAQSLSQESLQPKLALPHLIGSSKFFSSRYVGLVEDEFRIVSRDLTPNNETIDETKVTQSPNISIPESSQSLQPSVPINLYIPIAKSLPPEVSASPTSTPQDAFKTISSNPVEQPLRNQSVINPPTYSNKVPTPKPKTPLQKQGTYTDNEPPPVDSDDDDDDNFKPIVGAGGRLFVDDDDDDGDIFNDSSLFPSTNKAHNPFFNTPNIIQNIAPASRLSPPPYDIHDTHPSTKTQSDVGHNPKVKDKIADSVKAVHQPDESIKEAVTSGSKLKLPPGAVSIFGNVPPPEIPRLRTQQNTEPTLVVAEPETQLPGSSSKWVNVSDRDSSVGTNEDHETVSHSSLTSRDLTSSQGSLNDPIVSRTKPKGIFNDESDDDDLFSSRKPPVSSSSRGNALFKNNLTVDRPISSINHNKPSKQKLRSSIFDDSDDSEDDLFSSSSSASSKINQQKTKKPLVFPIQEESSAIDVSKSRHSSSRVGLFDDDDSDSEFFIRKEFAGINKLDKGINEIKTINKLEVNDKTKLKASNTKGSSLKSVITEVHTTTDSRTERIMQADEREEIEHPAFQDSAASAHSLNEDVVKENTLPPAEEDKMSVSGVIPDIVSETKTPYSQSPESIDNPDNKSVGLIQTTEISHGTSSKISKLKDKLAASETKILQSPSSETKPGYKKSTDVEGSKIGKLKERLSSSEKLNEKLPSADDTNSAKVHEKSSSKISKLKDQLSSTDLKPAKHDTLSTVGKPKVDVKKLALGLKINPLAMMPGAKPVKQGSLESPSSETEVLSDHATPESPKSLPISPLGEVDVKKLALGLNINPLAMIPGAKRVKLGSLDNSPEAASSPSAHESNAVADVSAPESPNAFATPPPLGKVVDVKKLALDLKIDPMAMMPGAKHTRQTSLESLASEIEVVSETGTITINKPVVTAPLTLDDEIAEDNAPSPADTDSTLSATPHLSSPLDKESSDANPLLRNLARGRARIQFKRRPPSKKLLHSCKSEESEVQDNDILNSLDEHEDISVESESVGTHDNVGADFHNVEVPNNISVPTTPEIVEIQNDFKGLSINETRENQKDDKPKVIGLEEPKRHSIFEEIGAKDIEDDSIQKSGAKPIAASIWDDSDSDDIFAASKKSAIKQQKLPSMKKTDPESSSSGLFTNPASTDNLTLLNSKTEIEPKETSAGSTNASKAQNKSDDAGPSLVVKQHKSLFSDDDQEDQKSDEEICKNKNSSVSNSSRANNLTSTSKSEENKKSKRNKANQGLFGSDSDSDDLFKSSAPTKLKAKAKKDTSTAGASSLLTESSVSKSMKSGTTKKSIFDDSSDEDLFATKKSMLRKKT